MAKDMQKETSGFYPKGINKVGVRNMLIPLIIDRKNSPEKFHTIAKVSGYCNLVPSVKGIHMSRISRDINSILAKYPSFNGMEAFVTQLRDSQGSKDAYIKASFVYIMEREAPISGTPSLEPVNVEWESYMIDGVVHNLITVESVEMSLCPCSKEMSMLANNLTIDELQLLQAGLDKESPLYKKIMMAGFGAHNQKSLIKVKVEVTDNDLQRMWIEDLVFVIRRSASCPTWATLKRPDEKYVTEVSYLGGFFDDETKQFTPVEDTGPKFVEDIARDVAKNLDGYLDSTIADYSVVVSNQESIHSQDIEAVAVVTAGRCLK